MDTAQEIPLSAFRVVDDGRQVTLIEKARVEADGDDWGELDISVAQARLEEGDDLAILQLRTAFTTEEALSEGCVEVNAAGLRTLEVDGTYCVPAKGEESEGCERYRLPDPFPEGEHVLVWSYVWNPPKDRSSGEPLPDGVTLIPPRLSRPDPARAVRLQAELDVTAGAGGLVVEGPAPGSVSACIDGQELPPADAAGRIELPPGSDGAVTLDLAVTGGTRVSAARLVR